MGTVGVLGRFLVLMGVILALSGLFLIFLDRLGGSEGWRLPGDIVLRRGTVTIFIPIATSLLLSVLFTLLLSLLGGAGRR